MGSFLHLLLLNRAVLKLFPLFVPVILGEKGGEEFSLLLLLKILVLEESRLGEELLETE